MGVRIALTKASVGGVGELQCGFVGATHVTAAGNHQQAVKHHRLESYNVINSS